MCKKHLNAFWMVFFGAQQNQAVISFILFTSVLFYVHIQTGKCIPPSYRCDTHFDCEDGEDESNCPVTCRENEYTCPASDMAPGLTMCVELYKVCDNFPDCIGSADEQPGCGKCDLIKSKNVTSGLSKNFRLIHYQMTFYLYIS